MVNVLQLLRTAIASDAIPTEQDGNFVFAGDVKVAHDAPSGLEMKNGGQYPLDAIIFFYNNRELGIGDYLKAAHAKKLVGVKYFDQKQILKALSSDAGDGSVATKGGQATETQDKPEQSSLSSFVFNREVVAKSRNKVLLSSQTLEEVISLEKIAKRSTEPTQKKLKTTTEAIQSGLPIIVVPASLSSPLNIQNITTFLQDGKFQASSKSLRTPNEVFITHQHSEFGKVTFKVVDSTRKFEERHWKRVVAVFVQGQDWQFKGWKWEKPAEVLQEMKGFFVCFDDAKVPPKVKSWNVNIIQLKKQQRHLDGVNVYKIWQELDTFLSFKKRFLFA